jgi:hypothetical protein
VRADTVDGYHDPRSSPSCFASPIYGLRTRAEEWSLGLRLTGNRQLGSRPVYLSCAGPNQTLGRRHNISARAVRAQQRTMPVVGLLGDGSPDTSPWIVDAIPRGLADAGYVEGRNVSTEYR